MKIGSLGWGLLIWKSGALPVASAWYSDGPRVPIEFVRISEGGELATAICLNAMPGLAEYRLTGDRLPRAA